MGFAEPDQATSISAEPVETPVPQAPAEPPQSFQSSGPSVPLDSVAAAPADTRDPLAPFVTVSSVMTPDASQEQPTSGFAVPVEAPVSPKTPYEPFRVASSSPIVSPTWGPPPPTATPAPLAPPVHLVTLSECLTAAYPPMLIALVVGGFVGMLNVVFPIALLVLTPFLFVPRVRVRVAVLKIASFVVLGAMVIGVLLSVIMDSTMYNVDLHLSWWTMIGSWGLALAAIILQWLGLRRGEAPPVPPQPRW